MRNAGKALFYAAGFVALAVATRGSIKSPDEQETQQAPAFTLSGDNPYGAIVERNIFDLHDPPPPTTKDDKPKEPPANVKLTGITTIFGHKQALFIVNEAGGPGKQAVTRSLILNEGQRDGVLEVLEINPKMRTAKIKNEDVESLIHIETNKAAASGGPAPAGGTPGAHVPGGQPGGYPHGGFGNPRGEPIPARPLRTEAQPSAPGQNYGNAGVAPQQNYGGYGGATPTGALGFNGTTTPGGQTAAPSSGLTPQEQYTLAEAQRAQSLSGQADPNLALMLPPTPLTPGLNQQNQSSTGGPPVPTAPTGPVTAAGTYTGSLSGGIYVPPK